MVTESPKSKLYDDENFGVADLKTEISIRIALAIRDAGGPNQVSHLSGVSRKTLHNYSSGGSEPKIVSLSKIAKVCEVSLDWLATGETQETKTIPLNTKALEAAFEVFDETLANRGFASEHNAKILTVLYEEALKD